MPASPKYQSRHCNECGAAYQPGRMDQFFCANACRMTFENRRMIRGKEIYDLFMIMRYERGIARVRGIWAIACRLAQQWKAEDDALRGGRRSWTPSGRALERYPVTMTTADAYVKSEKFGRAGTR
jgi:predicted nucleic acid-binding Zn ribbon protein